ncbi:MAG: LPS export ABC transporter periplasmic protein LptC [Sphingobacteriia bacterium]|nr:LPS export ABC transporter periplasmic protein LptC [Sphingobacteriia bacterium]
MNKALLINKISSKSKAFVFKVLCLSIFISIIVSLGLFMTFNSNTNKIVFKSVVNNQIKKLDKIIRNPVLYGYDDKEQPYNVMAKEAFEVNKDEVKLVDLTAEAFSNSGKWVAALAEQGILGNNNSTLDLVGAVQIFTNNAEEFKTDKVRLYLKEGVAESTAPVELFSEKVTLNATGIKITKHGKNIQFTGPVKMVIYQ